ncbi:cytochrome c oxidase subunit 5B, mitochondrial-like [Onthophagus taurus]|uniref:cytochrome c oxidase subunit 5B, mitochondrial-like n=1 Tax=Onthophagus taurus TaxID=166361 RepID=UPI000C205955|nr:cytochrome c oxidase subunit 5B, mitochondrial-like [Onthophagus taurus]
MNAILKRFLRFQMPFSNNFGQKRFKKTAIGDPVDIATGLEKRYLLAQLAGNLNPFCLLMLERGPATKCQPHEIPSAYDRRIIGCVCECESCSITYMWLHKDAPKRCECGYWFKLVQVPPV